jgi:hypothetical protein
MTKVMEAKSLAADTELRQRSVGAIEYRDEHGNTKTVRLADMTDADRELVEKFGYNPVIDQLPLPGYNLPCVC